MYIPFSFEDDYRRYSITCMSSTCDHVFAGGRSKFGTVLSNKLVDLLKLQCDIHLISITSSWVRHNLSFIQKNFHMIRTIKMNSIHFLLELIIFLL